MRFRSSFTMWVVLSAFLPLWAQQGGLTPTMIRELQESFVPDPSTKVLMNAVAANDIRKLAMNRQTAVSSDSYFSHKLKTEGITDQKSSGRCWLFAGLNLMRPLAMTSLNKKGFEFSQNYLFFFDKLEKANLFLQSIIETRSRPLDDRDVEWLLKNPFPDGGQWNMVVALVQKYGVVPSDVMPETESSSNTGTMNALISTKLRKDASLLRDLAEKGSSQADLEKRKMQMLGEVYRMLAMHLGVPPTRFEWRYEDATGKVSEPRMYTPQEFYAEHVNMKVEEYVCLYSVPAHPFNAMYQIRYDRNMADQPNLTFANVDIATLKDLTLKSLLANEPVWFGCDVGKESDSKSGLMRTDLFDYDEAYGVDMKMSKADRVRYQESVPSHAMVFTGVDVVAGKPRKWLVENSWGRAAGSGGMFTMYDPWFDEYMYTIIIHKKHLPASIAELFKQKPTVLPPWDPMFSLNLQ